MIKSGKNFDEIPTALQNCFETKQENLIKNREQHDFDTKCYHHAILGDLRLVYHDKCAYCDKKLEVDKDENLINYNIDHFRPKKRGYWWLGYEWSNLVLSCKACNDKKLGKFEIEGQKARSPLKDGKLDLERCKANHADLSGENPLFFHPDLEFPYESFSFEKSGKIVGLDKRGKYCVSELNYGSFREVDRKTILDNLINKVEERTEQIIKELVGFPKEAQALFFYDIFEDIIDRLHNPKRQFRVVAYYLYQDFEKFFSKYVEEKYGTDLRKLLDFAWSEFLKNT